MNGDLLVALLCLAGAVLIGAAGILIDRPEKLRKVRAAGAHTRRGVRRARRAAEQSEDDQTVTWLAELHRRPLRSVRPLALARARVAGLLAVLPARDREPRCDAPGCGRPADAGCRHITPADVASWDTAPGQWDTGRPLDFAPCPSCGGGPSDLHGECEQAPGPWDTDEARAELVPLPPMPVDLGGLATRYAYLFDEPGPDSRPEIELTVVDPPPGYMDELRALLAGAVAAPVALPGPNAAAGNWAPRRHMPLPVADFDPASDPAGWRHLRYPWADQLAADFDDQEAARG